MAAGSKGGRMAVLRWRGISGGMLLCLVMVAGLAGCRLGGGGGSSDGSGRQPAAAEWEGAPGVRRAALDALYGGQMMAELEARLADRQVVVMPLATPLAAEQLSRLHRVFPGLGEVCKAEEVAGCSRGGAEWSGGGGERAIPQSFTEHGWCGDFKAALADPAVRFLWSLRGGYGSAKLAKCLPLLGPGRVMSSKVLIGFSDLTWLMIATHQLYGWPNIHGDVFYQVVQDGEPRDLRNLRLINELIHGRVEELVIPGLTPLNQVAVERGAARRQQGKSQKLGKNEVWQAVKGRMHGGNLEVVTRTLGTDFEIETRGAILLLEDTNVKAYQVDRALNHLIAARKFDGVAAVVFGSFSSVAAGAGAATGDIGAVLTRFAAWANFPVYATQNCGHEAVNLPWIYGAAAYIEQGRLVIKVPESLRRSHSFPGH